MARIPWQLIDPITAEVYEMAINPNEGGSPDRKKTLTIQNTSAPDGRPLIFEGRDEIPRVSVSGVILSQELYEKIEDWYHKRNTVTLIDDLGRTFTIYITSFSPQRVRSRTHPWRHTYQLEYLVLD